jgi:hypothetical protein
MYTLKTIRQTIKTTLPYPEQTRKFRKLKAGIRFEWRGVQFRVDIESGMVEEVETNESTLHRSNEALLVEALILPTLQRKRS